MSAPPRSINITLCYYSKLFRPTLPNTYRPMWSFSRQSLHFIMSIVESFLSIVNLILQLTQLILSCEEEKLKMFLSENQRIGQN